MIQNLSRKISKSSLRLCLIIVLMNVFFISAAPYRRTHILQTIGLSSSIVATKATSLATVVGVEYQDRSFLLGYKQQPQMQDVALRSSFILAEQPSWTKNALISYAHGSFGTASAYLFDVIIGYERQFFFQGKNLAWDLSYGLGVQGSMSVLPFIDKPLYNASPYLSAKITCTSFDRLELSAHMSTSTMFTYACQLLSPITGAGIAWKLTDSLHIGGTYDLQYSDVYPESVIFFTKEAEIYAKWTS